MSIDAELCLCVVVPLSPDSISYRSSEIKGLKIKELERREKELTVKQVRERDHAHARERERERKKGAREASYGLCGEEVERSLCPRHNSRTHTSQVKYFLTYKCIHIF